MKNFLHSCFAKYVLKRAESYEERYQHNKMAHRFALLEKSITMRRPDYRNLQALNAVISERSFERAAQKLHITQSAVSQRIKQLENQFGQPLLIRTLPPRATEQGQKLLALLHQVELLEAQWLGHDSKNSVPQLLSLAVNADSLATWFLPALKSVLADLPIRLNLKIEDEERTQERLRRGEVIGAVSIQSQPLPSCLVDKLGALDYLFVASPEFAQHYFPKGVTQAALLKAPAVTFDHLDDMHQAFLQLHFQLAPGSIPCHIINSSEAFVQLARQGTACGMLPHLQIENDLMQGTLLDITPGLYQRRMLYWHRFAPESRLMEQVTDALITHGRQVLRQS